MRKGLYLCLIIFIAGGSINAFNSIEGIRQEIADADARQRRAQACSLREQAPHSVDVKDYRKIGGTYTTPTERRIMEILGIMDVKYLQTICGYRRNWRY